MEKDLEDSVILRNVINALEVKQYEFTEKLAYSSKTTIQNVLRGITPQMTKEMIRRITEAYPQVSYVYLSRGKGNPLVEGAKVNTQRNMLSNKQENANPIELFITMPEQVKYLVSAVDELKKQNKEILEKLEILINNK